MGGTKLRATVVAGAMLGWAAIAGGVLAADHAVTIAQFAYSPSPITIKVGDSVTWTNNDGVSHTATGQGWDSGTVSPSGSATVTFTKAGTFTYVCQFHGNMQGSVVVQAASGGSGGSGSDPTTPPTDTVARVTSAGGGATGFGPAVLLLALAAALGLAAGWQRVGRVARGRVRSK